MRLYDHAWLTMAVAQHMRLVAKRGSYDGWAERTGAYLAKCGGLHVATGSQMVFSRDVGMHASGWWKNPEYDRCWHLSLSFVDPANFANRAPRDRKLTKTWVDAFFGPDKTKLWCEPPYSAEGKIKEIWHYRLFCDQDWHPIIPRKEVYTKEFTELGWKSFSEVQYEMGETEERVNAMLADASRHQAAEGERPTQPTLF
jgi:hypothetical protein